jgi:hypothetical protein
VQISRGAPAAFLRPNNDGISAFSAGIQLRNEVSASLEGLIGHATLDCNPLQ